MTQTTSAFLHINPASNRPLPAFLDPKLRLPEVGDDRSLLGMGGYTAPEVAMVKFGKLA